MLPRHTVAWIARPAHGRVLARAEPRARAMLGEWLARERPFCVRRCDEDELRSASAVALGLPLPPREGKLRLRLHVDRDDIARAARPLSLRAIVAHAPIALRASIAAFAAEAGGQGVSLRVFGSFAWQALTGLRYVTVNSDLDLLVGPSDAAALDRAIALLTDEEARLRLRLDGEVVFPHGDAVAWREWRDADRGRPLLVKRIDGVRLAARADLLGQLQERAGA